MSVKIKNGQEKKVELKESQTEVSNTDMFEFKKRMLRWHNPVEFVNNMYGSHPSDENSTYFDTIFKK